MVTSRLCKKQCEISISRIHLLADGSTTGTSSITGDSLEEALRRAGFVEDKRNSNEVYEQPQEKGSLLPYSRFRYERFDCKWRKGDLGFSLSRDSGVIYCHPEQQQSIINELNEVRWEKEASYLHKTTWGENVEYLRLLARPVEYYEYDIDTKKSAHSVEAITS